MNSIPPMLSKNDFAKLMSFSGSMGISPSIFKRAIESLQYEEQYRHRRALYNKNGDYINIEMRSPMYENEYRHVIFNETAYKPVKPNPMKKLRETIERLCSEVGKIEFSEIRAEYPECKEEDFNFQKDRICECLEELIEMTGLEKSQQTP